MALPTVRQAMTTAELQRGEPVVYGGGQGLEATVRWVHVSELPDIAYLLRGGELLLTTGVALPAEDRALRRYVDELAAAMVSGVVIELGRKFDTLPRALVESAERRGLPLIGLTREILFVNVTEQVHSLIVNAQLEELRTSETVHQAFTDLSLEGASPTEIVRHVARLVGSPVVLENLAHQVLAFEPAGRSSYVVLDDWENRSRLVRTQEQTEYVPTPVDWVVTMVGARGEWWGRLIIVDAHEDSHLHVIVAERGAGALALNRLLAGDQETMERQAHHFLLTKILDRAYSCPAEVFVRAQSLGVRLQDHDMIAMVVTVDLEQPADDIDAAEMRREEAELVARAVRGTGTPALVSPLEGGRTGLLLGLRPGAEIETGLGAVAREVGRMFATSLPHRRAVIGVGTAVSNLSEVRRSFREATHVADAATESTIEKPYYRLCDIRLPGLLALMRDDVRLQSFVERELGPLLSHDTTTGDQLLDVLSAYLEHGRNKATAASAVHLSRPAFYTRLARVAEILDTDLDSTESCVSLHVALLTLRSMRRQHSDHVRPLPTSS